MVLMLMIMRTSIPPLITELEDEEKEGQGLGELKNLGNYLSAPTADLRNYFSLREPHHKR